MKALDWLFLIGGGVGTYFICKKVYASMAKPLPEPAPGPSPSGPSGGPRPTLLSAGPIQLTPGRSYFAAVNVGFPASMGASRAKITELATKKGFNSVMATESPLAGWPGTAKADWYIYGNYQGAPTSIDRNPGPGVEVVEAFIQ